MFAFQTAPYCPVVVQQATRLISTEPSVFPDKNQFLPPTTTVPYTTLYLLQQPYHHQS